MTISELAHELGISKPGLTKKIKSKGWFDRLERDGNKYVVPDDLAEDIRQLFENHSKTNTNESATDANQLAFLMEQIRIKDEQIAKLQDTLEREQQLHAADKKQLLQLTAEAESRRGFWSFFKRKKQ